MTSRYLHGFLSCIFSITLFSLAYTPLYAVTDTSSFNSSLNSHKRYGITLVAPDIAENGAVVSVNVNMFGFESTDVYVKELKLFVCHMGFRPIQVMTFHRPTSQYRTRIRMNKTDSIFAMARLTTGEYVYAQKLSLVTRGGCGGMSLPYSSEAITDASTPSGTSNQHARSWIKSSLPTNSTRLITSNGRRLEQKSMRVDVKIVGHRARVLLDMEFYHPNRTQGEGRFQLRLPESAVPYYVAFGDVVVMNKKMSLQYLPSAKTSGFSTKELQFDRHQHPAKFKEAVMVPRKQARNAYQTIVGKRRDPALIEWQGNGIYSVNVFPLQPFSSHRVAIAYDMELPKTAEGHLQYTFKSPANIKIPTDVYLRTDNNTAEKIHSISLVPELVSRDKTRLYHFKPEHKEELNITFKDQDARYLHGRDPASGDYFSAQLSIPLPTEIAHHSNHNAVFALDSSASPGGSVFANQLEMMLNLLAANDDDIKNFAVLFFDVGTHWWQKHFVSNTKSNRQRLNEYAQAISLVGATDLQRALTEMARPHWFKQGMADNWDVFLFTDGFATWGDTRPAALLKSIKGAENFNHISHLYAYVEQNQRTDMDILDLLTHETDGAIYNFSGFELASENSQTQTHQAMRAHRMRNWRIVSAHAQGAEDIFIANTHLYTFTNQQIHFVGRGLPEKEIVIVVKHEDEVREVSVTMPTTVLETELTPRIYAEAAVRKLEDSSDLNETLTLAYATHFRIPRQTVSLLMLETQKDYDRFNIINKADFANYVNEHYVADVIANQTPPEVISDLAYDVPPLPANQLEVITQLNHSFTICKIPSAYLPDINPGYLSNKKPLQHRPLQLTKDAVMQKVDLNYYYYLDNSLRQSLVSNANRFRSQSKSQASLRLLSSIMEYPQVTFEDRISLSKQLIRQGYGNESYFLLSMTPRIFGSNDVFDLLISSIELQDEPEFAQAMRKITKLDSLFNKLALQP